MKERIKIRLLSPLSHGGFGPSTGNSTLIRRISVWCPGAGMIEVPCLSGNALRGMVRRVLFRDLFARLRIDQAALRDKQWDRLYAALANGGTLSGSEKTVDPDRIRRLRAEIPPLSVLGSALYSYMLPGHVSFGICWPVCQETAAAKLVTESSSELAESLVEEVSLVRLPDTDRQDVGATSVGPMPTTFEAIKTGARLECELIFAPHTSEIEVSAIGYALGLIDYVGGKIASGHGRVEIQHSLDPEPYTQWLADASPVPFLDLAREL